MNLAWCRAAIRAIAVACVLSTALVAPVATAAQADASATPKGEPGLHDPVFRVHGPELGLERRVAMYQQVAAGEASTNEWSEVRIDGNPEFPLQGERWMADRITVDGYPLAPGVIEALGEWREFRPGFSALPGNLSATFQPEGDGLGSAENPLAPQIGDLRIHWRELVLPPLAGRIELRDGRWQLAADAPALAAAPTADRGWLLAWLPIIAGGLGLLVLAVVLARRRR